MQFLYDGLNQLYLSIGLNATASISDVFGVFGVLFMLGASAKNFLAPTTSGPQAEQAAKVKVPKEIEAEAEEKVEAKVEVEPEHTPGPEVEEPPKESKESWAQRLRKGLSQSRNEIWSKVSSIVSKGIDQDVIEEVEELLYSADIGPSTVQDILDMLEQNKDDLKEKGFKTVLHDFLKHRLDPFQKEIDPTNYIFEGSKDSTKTIMIVGVNGVGKTTTIGKLATRLTRQGASVVVGAGDTFRAAAVDQLQVWCERSGASMIRTKEGGSPSAVAFDAVKQAVDQKSDYCLVDTAGRLHNNANLMQELVKIKEVMAKNDPDAPQEIWLVLDAITGQNAMRQAKEFNDALGLTGVIFTKCDGSSKAGSAISIVEQLKVPIVYIGVGEDVDDLNKFEVEPYLSALIN